MAKRAFAAILRRLRAAFLLVRLIGLADVLTLGGLAAIGWGAWALDMHGAALLVGALAMLLGISGARREA